MAVEVIIRRGFPGGRRWGSPSTLGRGCHPRHSRPRAFISVATTVGIVIALLAPALEFFADVSPADFFTGTEWAPLFADQSFGVLPLSPARW